MAAQISIGMKNLSKNLKLFQRWDTTQNKGVELSNLVKEVMGESGNLDLNCGNHAVGGYRHLNRVVSFIV